MRYFWLLLIVASTLSCSRAVYESAESETFNQRVMPYTQAFPKKGESTKRAVILNDNPDTLQLQESRLSKYLIKQGYELVFPDKPGEHVFQTEDLDAKDYRVRDIARLIEKLDSQQSTPLLLIGFGEGGYLTPSIARKVNPENFVVINAGPTSRFNEYESLAADPTQDSVTLKKILRQNRLEDAKALGMILDSIKAYEFGQPLLKGGNNHYWMSYFNDPVVAGISELPGKGWWIIPENYGLIDETSRKLVKGLCQNLPNLNYLRAVGNGNYNNDDEMKWLIEFLDTIIPK